MVRCTFTPFLLGAKFWLLQNKYRTNKVHQVRGAKYKWKATKPYLPYRVIWLFSKAFSFTYTCLKTERKKKKEAKEQEEKIKWELIGMRLYACNCFLSMMIFWNMLKWQRIWDSKTCPVVTWMGFLQSYPVLIFLGGILNFLGNWFL